MERLRQISRKLFAVLLVVCVLGGGWVFYKLSGSPGTDILSRIFHKPSVQATSVRVVYTTRYLKCDDTVVESEEVSRENLEPFLASISSDWKAVGQDESSVYLLRTVDDYCPVHSRFRLLILTPGGYVAVYRGKVADPRFLEKEIKSLTEANMDAKTRDMLKQGVIIEDDPEVINETVRLYLEGIND